MKMLTGVDGAFLHLETPATPMHVGSLHVFDLPSGYQGDFHADIKRQMRKRLHIAPVFTHKLAAMPLQFSNPVWVEEKKVDLAYHIQHVTLPSPGSQAQLEDCTARLHSELLDRSRPLWQLAIIDGLQTGQVAYYIKVHHAVLDGQAGVLLAQALFDTSAQPLAAPRRTLSGTARATDESPGMAELALAALKHDGGQYIKLLRHLPDVLKTLVGLFGSGPKASAAAALPKGAKGLNSQNFAFGPKTPLNQPITPERGFASLQIPMATLKQLAAIHEAKLNDVVLALCSGALRRYLAQHGGIPKKSLIAAMPISLREAGNTEMRTQATLSLVNLNTQIADPVKRLLAIRDASGAMKALAQRGRSVIPTDFPAIGVPWLLQGLAALYGRSGITRLIAPIANVVISNVAGPQLPLYAAGARMVSYSPLSITEHGLGLNITVMSYAGAMSFGFTTATAAVPDARELSAALAAALEELLARSTPALQKRPRSKPRNTPRNTPRTGAAAAPL